MQRIIVLLLSLFAVWGIASELEFRPTFESCGVYFRTTQLRSCTITYREVGTENWLPAFEPVFDRNYDACYRSSIVDLRENTGYEVKAEGNGREPVTGTFHTWADEVPVAKEIILSPSEVAGGLVITAKGSPDGYICYTAEPGVIIDAGADKNESLLLDGAEYVLVRNLVIRGGRNSAVRLQNCRYVRLVNCEISEWCDAKNWQLDRGSGRMRNAQGHALWNKNGISIDRGFGQVIERCFIYDPALTANAWRYGHPDGPQGIAAWKPASTVIRYNDICGSDLRWWNDGIAGSGNFDLDGGLNRDADVYGNYIAFANDDAIELDGGQQNVRCFRNYFENCFMGISVQGSMTGPAYVFENLVVNLADEFGERASAFKTADLWNGFYTAAFFYHNTAANPGGTLNLPENMQMVARNNILRQIKSPLRHFLNWDHSHNLVEVEAGPKDLLWKPAFLSPENGNFALCQDSPGLGAGTPIPGLNNTPPDIGVPHGMLLPLRPFALQLPERRQVHFTVRNGEASAMQTVPVHATDTPVSFTVRKSADASWFEVEPLNATLQPSESVVLNVRIKPALMNKQVYYRGTFFLRSAEGWSRPVSVTAKTDYTVKSFSSPDCYEFVLWAPFTALPDGGVRLEGSEMVKFEFEQPKEGYVFILLEARAPGSIPTHDSVWIGVNTETPEAYAPLTLISQDEYRLLKIAPHHLPAGKHYIMLKPREVIDARRLFVTRDVTIFETR